MESGCYLCDDLLSYILAQLPTKSLVRFKSVSKSWRSLIEDPCFPRKSPKKLIIFTSNGCFSSDLHSVSPGNCERVDLPVELSYSTLEPVGSCNGLILLKDSKITDRLWMLNASTRECYSINSIPEVISSSKDKHLKCTSYGFGYDSVNDDYKVIMIFSFENNHLLYTNQTYVYSLRNNTWRRTQIDFGPFSITETPGVLLAGKLYWDAYSYSKAKLHCCIRAFDISSEEVAALPPKAEGENDTFPSLSELEGCLAAKQFRVDKENSVYVSIWVLKESQWVQLLRAYDDSLEVINPLVYSNTGDQVLMYNSDSYFWYKIENGKVEQVLERTIVKYEIICLDTPVSIGAYKRSDGN